MDIYSLYCPLRNCLRKQSLDDSLLAIHSHIQFQQFRKPLPPYIVGTPLGYRNISTFEDLINFHLFPWELVLLCKEVLINSSNYSSHSLLEWRYLSSANNKLKTLEDDIAGIYSSKDNILLEVFRIIHRQFRWQRRPTLDIPARYWKLLSYQNLAEIVKEQVGLTIEDIIKIGMGLVGFYEDKIALFYPPTIDLPGITQNKIEIFLNHFCLEYQELRQKLVDEQRYDERFAYSYTSLVAFPLIKKKWLGRMAIVCPIPRFLFERITDGIYYEIYKAKNFDNVFGQAFQDYVGDTIRETYSRNTFLSEAKYEKNKRTSDWIIKDVNTTVLIECKTKRLKNCAKTELINTIELDLELGKLADAIVQIYKTMADYIDCKYPQTKYISGEDLYPVIVTLEEWFVYGERIINKLDTFVLEKFKSDSRLVGLRNKHPYCVVSIGTFESIMYLANIYGFKQVLASKLFDNEKKYWEVENYLYDKFPSEMRNIGCPFVNELKSRIDQLLS